MNKVKSIIMPITGLSCCNCAIKIDALIGKLQGIIEVHTDFTNEKLKIIYDKEQLELKDIIINVNKLGYKVAVGKFELPITGLQDQSAALSLEQILLKQDGLISAVVSYSSENVIIEYIPGMTSVSILAELIRKAGYDIVQAGESEELEDVEAKVRESETKKTKEFANFRNYLYSAACCL